MPRRSICKSDSATKQSALPIQVTPVVEQEVGVGKEKSKNLHSLTVDGCQMRVEYRVNTKTGHSGIYNSFTTRSRMPSKMLYSSNEEGVQTAVYYTVNPKTGHVRIHTTFRKPQNWNGGACTNSDCNTFLGVVMAERVLSKVFKNVQRMQPNNPGYDFICKNGFKIDVKSGCMRKKWRGWTFTISRNQEADYFLCLAFDNRKDLNPQHIWLIPGKVVNHLTGTSISISTLEKWSQYELTDKIDDVITCCDALKD